MHKRRKLKVNAATLRHLETAVLQNVDGGSPNGSDDGHVCESVNACPGSVAPYACATDYCQTHSPPCNDSIGPCV